MGKPLSRPDCLRQNPTCLGKGEEEDGYIEDCYVPQRSIYDTMRINEQIDQGSKLNQTSKSTMEKMEGSTMSSNGTLGAAANVFESRAPEGKKLDERIIFDALKLSSDVQKLAPVPPRRRPNTERKDNVNRRSWKSFMPPNFPEFAERMEASLSEVSEAGASNPSLQEKKESSSALTESSGHLDNREPQLESVTLEHVSKSIGIPEVQDMKNLSGDCQDFIFQQHSESSPNEFQPLESEAAAASGNTDVMQEHRFSSATWPRAMKSLAKGGFSEKQHPLGDAACTVEMPPLSPCLSEELLDPELHVLITPSLREKTESELKFEEDERWIMMEAEEEWEKLSEREKTFLMADEKKNSLTDIFEDREQANTGAVVEDGSDCSAAILENFDPLALGQICCSDDLQPPENHLASVLTDTPLDYSCILIGENDIGKLKNRTSQELEDLISDLEYTVGPVNSEQLSDTDSVQMFLELEKECLCEEGGTPLVELENQASSEGLAPPQDTENSLVISHFSGAALEKEHISILNVRVKDDDTGLDCEYFNALDSSQVPNAVELIALSDNMRDTSTVSEKCEKVPFSPKTAGEFRFRHPADLESPGKLGPGGLPNSDCRVSHEENLSAFEAELAKENGCLFQVDCSQIEGNVERVPLGSAFSYELADITSGSEVEVLSCGSHLPTDEIHLESEKGAVNQENSLTSLGTVEPCELSTEKVYDESQELGYEAQLLEDQAQAHFYGDFPEQVFQDLQRKSPESEILSLHLLDGGQRHNSDGEGTVNDIKSKLNVASLSEDETEMRDSESLLNIFLGEQITKASNTEPVLEEWIPIREKPAPTAAVSTIEDALDAAVLAPEGTAVAAVTVPFPDEDMPVASVATIEAHVPALAVPASEGTAPAAAVPTTGEDIPEGSVTPAAVVPAPEEPVTPAVIVLTPKECTAPAAAVPTPEEPAAPIAAVPTPEEPAAPTAAVPTSEEPAVPTAAVPTSKEPAAPAAAVPTPEEPAAPTAAVPTLEEAAALTAAMPTPEEAAALAVAVPTPEEPAAPTAAVPTPEEAAALTAAVPTPEEAAVPAAAVPTSEEPVAPTATMPTPEEPAAPTAAMPIPEEPTAPAAAVPTPEEPTSSADRVPTPQESATAAAAMPTPEETAAPAASVPSPEETTTPAAAVPSPEEPASPAAAVRTPEEHAGSVAGVPTPEELATPAAAVPTLEEPATTADRVPTSEEPPTPAAAVPAVEEVFLAGVHFLGDTVHTDSVPISEEGTPVLEDSSSTGMWIKEDLDSPAFGIKEVTGTVLHGKVPLAASDGLNSNEVIVAHFVREESRE
ncbi:uncharacterized protein KIAA0754 homolog [Molossus molossus]|uniref:uncharacterized protein KIAA0754 homolog n=1 Tax=Molossus molossus TaxID=27622 RepID=UPI0017475BB5|nr:uncharacterized protein KIAA0754 homolog [Molossus molossus]